MRIDLMRDMSKFFPEINNKFDVTKLRIWNCKYKNLDVISEFTNLKELVILSFPDVSLENLSNLKNLEYLSIIHMPKITDIGPLSQLNKLESLSLSTIPAWDASNKYTVIKSLQPISLMDRIKHLELMGVCVESKSLAELESCKTLQSAKFARYPQNEVDRFFKAAGILNKHNPESSFDD